MGKYGKTFRKNQLTEWKEKYLPYKTYKQTIKQLLAKKNDEEFKSKNEKDKIIEKINGLKNLLIQSIKILKNVIYFFQTKKKSYIKTLINIYI